MNTEGEAYRQPLNVLCSNLRTLIIHLDFGEEAEQDMEIPAGVERRKVGLRKLDLTGQCPVRVFWDPFLIWKGNE